MKRTNSSAAALCFEDWVTTMSSPPTTLTLPPGPAGTSPVCRSKLGYDLRKIGNIHGPSRIVAYLPCGSPSEVPSAPWSPVIRLGIAPSLYRSTSSCTAATLLGLFRKPVDLEKVLFV